MLISRGRFLLHSQYLAINLLIYYLLFAMIFLLLGRGDISIFVYSTLIILLTMVNYFVQAFRGSPFMLMDIFSAGTALEVTGSYSFKLPGILAFRLILVVLYLAFEMDFQTIRLGKSSRRNLLIRFSVFTACLCASVFGAGRLAQAEAISLWDTANDYREKGYLYSLICESKFIAIKEPAHYSPAAAAEIAEKAMKKDTPPSPNKITPENLIVIMNESFTDFGNLASIPTSQEVLPFFEELRQNTSSGYLHVPVFGGRTADSEYEVLTGNTKQFMPAASSAYQLYTHDPEYGLADILKSQGYRAIVSHPFWSRGWNRPQVYANMGFERFISLGDWEDETENLRKYATDKTAYDKIIRLYNEKNPHEKMFQFCVTMQNHGGYSDAAANGYVPEIDLSYDTEYPFAKMYLSLLHHSDTAFAQLIAYFEQVEEPTMIVMFGDHWPNLDPGFWVELFGKDLASLDAVERQQSYRTPYVIWTNYPSDIIHQDMSANYFGSYLLQQAGLEMPAYSKFLLQLKEKLPVIGDSMVQDAAGNWYPLSDLPPEYEKLINEYEILEYNNVFDLKHRNESVYRE